MAGETEASIAVTAVTHTLRRHLSFKTLIEA